MTLKDSAAKCFLSSAAIMVIDIAHSRDRARKSESQSVCRVPVQSVHELFLLSHPLLSELSIARKAIGGAGRDHSSCFPIFCTLCSSGIGEIKIRCFCWIFLSLYSLFSFHKVRPIQNPGIGGSFSRAENGCCAADNNRSSGFAAAASVLSTQYLYRCGWMWMLDAPRGAFVRRRHSPAQPPYFHPFLLIREHSKSTNVPFYHSKSELFPISVTFSGSSVMPIPGPLIFEDRQADLSYIIPYVGRICNGDHVWILTNAWLDISWLEKKRFLRFAYYLCIKAGIILFLNSFGAFLWVSAL